MKTAKQRYEEYIASPKFLTSTIWKLFRAKMIENHNGDPCSYCGCRLDTGDSRTQTTVDHDKSRHKYPELALVEWNSNVVCRSCNSSKKQRELNDGWEPWSIRGLKYAPGQLDIFGNHDFLITHKERDELDDDLEWLIREMEKEPVSAQRIHEFIREGQRIDAIQQKYNLSWEELEEKSANLYLIFKMTDEQFNRFITH